MIKFKKISFETEGRASWLRRLKQKLGAFYDLLGELVYRAMWVISWPIIRLFFKLEVKHLERIPEGPVIIAANHHSYIDPWVLQMAFPRRITYMVAHVFYKGLGWWFYRMHKAIPLKQRGLNKESLARGVKVLKESGVIAIFPEGWANGQWQPWRGNPGVALLAAWSHVPVLPVKITGAQEVLRRGVLMPSFVKISVSFGEPIYFNGTERPDKESLRKMTDLIMERIRELT
jgi:1-acyl-sn-glycerol-3-phosphate acyltransferase